jgi:NADPH-dependent 2,4-dienoyl-CoA reductase/sulfur reductase-like enzyme
VVDRLVIVGGDAGGMAAASQVRKGAPDAEIVALERGHWTSYSACGIPYLVGGEIDDVEQLIARRPQDFRDRDRVDVRIRHEAVAVDLAARKVEVRDLERDRTYRLGFDHLLLGTGGVPVRPNLAGIDLPFVHGVQTLDDAVHLVKHAQEVSCSRVVVVGGGYIGLEIAEAFTRRGLHVTVVERNQYVLGLFDAPLGQRVTQAMRREGIEVHLQVDVLGFRDGVVLTTQGELEAELVLLGLGVAPNSALARDAGLRLGVRDAVVVDRRQRTSAEGVWAAGDCCQSRNLVSGEPVHVPLGTVANKQSRVAGINIGGGYATFPGVLGTAISRFCALEVARTGLSTAEAARAGFESVTSVIDSTTQAGYMPDAEPMTVLLVVERRTGRLLGAQIVGGAGSAKRIDTFAVAITAGMTVEQIVQLDLAYAPPFSGVWDPVQVAAREAIKQI